MGTVNNTTDAARSAESADGGMVDHALTAAEGLKAINGTGKDIKVAAETAHDLTMGARALEELRLLKTGLKETPGIGLAIVAGAAAVEVGMVINDVAHGRADGSKVAAVVAVNAADFGGSLTLVPGAGDLAREGARSALAKSGMDARNVPDHSATVSLIRDSAEHVNSQVVKQQEALMAAQKREWDAAHNTLPHTVDQAKLQTFLEQQKNGLAKDARENEIFAKVAPHENQNHKSALDGAILANGSLKAPADPKAAVLLAARQAVQDQKHGTFKVADVPGSASKPQAPAYVAAAVPKKETGMGTPG